MWAAWELRFVLALFKTRRNLVGIKSKQPKPMFTHHADDVPCYRRHRGPWNRSDTRWCCRGNDLCENHSINSIQIVWIPLQALLVRKLIAFLPLVLTSSRPHWCESNHRTRVTCISSVSSSICAALCRGTISWRTATSCASSMIDNAHSEHTPSSRRIPTLESS